MSDLPQDDGPRGPIARFLAMPPDSTPKTFAVAVGVCLVASMLVSFAAVTLRPIQDSNRLVDKRRNILQVAGVFEPGMDVNAAFTEMFEPRVVELDTGTFSDRFDPATFDDAAASDDPELSTELADDPAGIGRRADFRTVYLLRDEAGDLDKIVLPVHGYGLWSTLYGFIALEENGNDIYGLQFYEHAETPGLGGEVDNPLWISQWSDKRLRDDQGDLRISVEKTPQGPDGQDYHIDALAGATLTSRGVDNLVKFWMGDQGFAPFLSNLQDGGV